MPADSNDPAYVYVPTAAGGSNRPEMPSSFPSVEAYRNWCQAQGINPGPVEESQDGSYAYVWVPAGYRGARQRHHLPLLLRERVKDTTP